MRLEVDGEEVVVEDSSPNAMKTRAFAPINLRATRQPQALNPHGRRAARLSPCDIDRCFEKGGESEKKLMHLFKGFLRAVSSCTPPPGVSNAPEQA